MVIHLVEDRAQLLEGEDAECVGGDGDDALGALQGVDSIGKSWLENSLLDLVLILRHV